LSAHAFERAAPGIARLVRLLALDAVVLGALIVGVALGHGFVTRTLAAATGIDPGWAFGLLATAACAAALPLVVGIGRLSRRLGSLLASFPWIGSRNFPPSRPILPVSTRRGR
jgi:hypothetical protein